MKVEIITKRGTKIYKETTKGENEFLNILTRSIWLLIENDDKNIYLRTSEIEGIIFIK